MLDGKAARESILERVRERVAAHGRPLKLSVILVGNDPASASYVASKEKAAATCGLRGEVIRLPAESTREQVLAVVRRLNLDTGVHGILCQLPMPAHIPENDILCAIDPAKDVDCLHPENLGRLVEGHPRVLPCTPGGIMALLSENGLTVEGKHCVVLGRSNIVGKPMAMLLLRANGTVTLCHSRTRDLPAFSRQADVLVAAIGRPAYVTADMVKEGAIVVDVGINRVDDPSLPKGYRLVGDVDFDRVAPRCEWITPVPGGVGPMTIATLMENVLRLAGIP
jgi:methylenetetrahydrofolate dehydrogenase (NADP+)/methenyltetrahydrofolate cyclohydrolase